jgi:hypothetical protein
MAGVSVLAMVPQLLPIEGIVLENEFNSDLGVGQTERGTVANDYRPSLGVLFGFAYRILPDWPQLSLGLNAYIPVDAVAYMDTGEAFLPEYPLYRARLHRPQVEAAIAGQIYRGLRLGVGARVGFSLSANASVFLKSKELHPSTMRFAASLQPKVAPYVGIAYASDEDPDSRRPGAYSLGLVARAPITSTNRMVMRANAQLFSTFAALGFNFTAASALYYDPVSVELGGSLQYSHWTRIFIQLDWQGWGAFEAPALSIGDEVTIDNCQPGSPNCGVILQPGRNPSFQARNIWVPRFGHELRVQNWSLRLGYSFRQGIFSSVADGNGNLIDADKHTTSLGVGYRFMGLFSNPTPLDLDFHVAWQHLASYEVSKAEPTQIGFPGYRVGGNIWGGGLSIGLRL